MVGFMFIFPTFLQFMAEFCILFRLKCFLYFYHYHRVYLLEKRHGMHTAAPQIPTPAPPSCGQASQASPSGKGQAPGRLPTIPTSTPPGEKQPQVLRLDGGQAARITEDTVHLGNPRSWR